MKALVFGTAFAQLSLSLFLRSSSLIVLLSLSLYSSSPLSPFTSSPLSLPHAPHLSYSLFLLSSLCPSFIFISPFSLSFSPSPLRSRLADFFANCQPEPRSVSGCLKESYADCLLAYSGLIGQSQKSFICLPLSLSPSLSFNG